MTNEEKANEIMTQEENLRTLLLKDLSSRLPYGVKAQYYDSEEGKLMVDTIEGIEMQPPIEVIIGQYGLGLEYVKPFLRSLSSMTDEELEELNKQSKAMYADDNAGLPSDYLNSIHVDYRGLIEKGLALEAPEGMYD